MKTHYQEMNINELQSYIGSKKPKTVTYSSKDSGKALSPVHQVLRFTELAFALPSNPNTLALKGSCGQMIFNNVYYFGVSNDGVFDVLKIRCRAYTDNSTETHRLMLWY